MIFRLLIYVVLFTAAALSHAASVTPNMSTQPSTSRATCKSTLNRSHRTTVTTSFRSPLLPQCGSSCSYLIWLGHLESHTRTELSAHWYTLRILEHHFNKRLKQLIKFYSHKSENYAVNDFFSLNESFLSEDFVGEVSSQLVPLKFMSQVGVVKSEDFQLPQNFINQMKYYANFLNIDLHSGDLAGSSLVIFHDALQYVLSSMHEKLKYGTPNRLSLLEVEQMQDFFRLALSGYTGGYLPRELYGDLVYKISGQRGSGPLALQSYKPRAMNNPLGINALDHKLDQKKLTQLIKQSMAKGHNLMVSYMHIDMFVDQTTREIDVGFEGDLIAHYLANDQQTERKALIEGYEMIGSGGEISKVYLKNFEGSSEFKNGYNWITLRALALLLNNAFYINAKEH